MNSLETHVLELIGEDTGSPDVFADDEDSLAPIRDSLNDAFEEICMLTGTARGTYYIPLKQSMPFYRMDFSDGLPAWITGIWLNSPKWRLDQTDLITLAQTRPRWLMNSGNPREYFPVGFKHFGIWPIPSADGGMLEVSAAIIPARYTYDGNIIRLKKNWQWAAVHAAVGEYYAGRGDAKRAVEHHQKYLDRMGLQINYPFASEQTFVLRGGRR